MQSLDNVRNTILGHLQIDYRIACAMSNFTHKPCETDGVNSRKIASQMKKKAKRLDNSMLGFMNKQLRTNSFKEIKLNDIDDFPKLKMSKIISRITFGTFQPKISLSYISDIIKNSVFEYLNKKKVASDSTKNKIIATEIPSRHKRSLNKGDKKRLYKNSYRVFVNYLPGINKAKAIKGKNMFVIILLLAFINIIFFI